MVLSGAWDCCRSETTAQHSSNLLETVGLWDCCHSETTARHRSKPLMLESEKCGSTRCTKLKLKLKLKPKCQPVRELPVSDSPWQPCLDSNTTLGANGEHVPLGRATDNHYRLPVPPHPLTVSIIIINKLCKTSNLGGI